MEVENIIFYNGEYSYRVNDNILEIIYQNKIIKKLYTNLLNNVFFTDKYLILQLYDYADFLDINTYQYVKTINARVFRINSKNIVTLKFDGVDIYTLPNFDHKHYDIGKDCYNLEFKDEFIILSTTTHIKIYDMNMNFLTSIETRGYTYLDDKYLYVCNDILTIYNSKTFEIVKFFKEDIENITSINDKIYIISNKNLIILDKNTLDIIEKILDFGNVYYIKDNNMYVLKNNKTYLYSF